MGCVMLLIVSYHIATRLGKSASSACTTATISV